MAKRSETTQSRHDEMVKRIAAGYLGQGWNVNADIRGYPQPKTLYGRRPDVIAQKGNKTKVIEVETPKTYDSDKSQRAAFRKWTSQNDSRNFRTKIAK